MSHPLRWVWIFLGVFLAFFSTGCEPLADKLDFVREEVPVFERKSRVEPDALKNPDRPSLRVMAWNIKFGGGRIDFWFDYWGDRVSMARSEVDSNMAGIYKLLNEYDPDILLVEEIEVNSRRSAYYDMLEGVLENTRLNYAAYYQTWNSRYIPSEGLGRVDLGNAIFSKYPIKSAERIRMEDRTDQDAVTQSFYLHRAIGRAVITAGNRELITMVVHTEAYDQDGTKRKHLKQIYDLMKEEASTGKPLLVGGDFNELPPSALKMSGFDDKASRAKGTEFEQPPYHPEDMLPFFTDFAPAIDLELYGETLEKQKRYYTHTTLGPDGGGFWNRTLDYLFVRKLDSWKLGSVDVLQAAGNQNITSDPMKLSDHAPVVGIWQVGP